MIQRLLTVIEVGTHAVIDAAAGTGAQLLWRIKTGVRDRVSPRAVKRPVSPYRSKANTNPRPSRNVTYSLTVRYPVPLT